MKAIDGLGGLDILVSNAGRRQAYPQITVVVCSLSYRATPCGALMTL